MTTVTQMNRRRRPWGAALLSVLVPGLGQLYNGRPVKASVMWTTFIAAGVAMLWFILNVSTSSIHVLIALAAVIATALWIIIDAYIEARRIGSEFAAKRYNRWYVYSSIVVLFALFVQPGLMEIIKSTWVEAFRLPHDSMAPTLMAGDYLLVKKDVPEDLRGRIVVFRPPVDEPRLYMQRVVALAGDTVAMASKVLRVNGQASVEPYVQHIDRDNDVYAPAMYWQALELISQADSARYRPTRDNWGPLVVPEAHVFVLGDNRDDSEDSRYFGFVRQSEIVGYPKRVYLATNWERIGEDVTAW